MVEAIPEGELPDDLSIDGRTKLLRRVPPGQYSPESGLPVSGTFSKDGSDSGTSVTLWLTGEDLRIVSDPHPAFGIVALYVEQVRAEELRIAYVDEPGNPNHCEIYGPRSSGKKRRLSLAVRWVKFPAGFPAELMAKHTLMTIDE